MENFEYQGKSRQQVEDSYKGLGFVFWGMVIMGLIWLGSLLVK